MTNRRERDNSEELPTRRDFFANAAAAGAVAALAATLNGSAAGAASRRASVTEIDRANVQGNILSGFNKDFEAFVFVTFPSPAAGRGWTSALSSLVTSDADIAAAEAGSSGSWINVAYTFAGLRALDLSREDLRAFPEEFRAGMRARAAALGDVGPSDPSTWPPDLQTPAHAVVIVGSDSSAQLDDAVSTQATLAASYGLTVTSTQFAAVRSDQPGFEHFGFRDGISQPGIRGYTPPVSPTNPLADVANQPLVWPGEFLLGYVSQAGEGRSISARGPVSTGGPSWSTDGSFLVLRRLRQDVATFRSFIESTASSLGMSEDLLMAKVVGRYPSGAPLEVTGAQGSDPGLSDTSLLTTSAINDFDYHDDPQGAIVPLSAHIRKGNPRDEPTRTGGEADTLSRRMLRRAIPFGASLPPGTPQGSPLNDPAYPDDRGLFFLCYQSSIKDQFEFVQSHWVNNPNFPRRASGVDPLISQTPPPAEFTLGPSPEQHVTLMARFVQTTGGDYFFQPSISALRVIST